MDYSQEPVLELFKAGKVPGETGTPKHIETVISNVFLFETSAYKIYKDNNQSFNTNFRNLASKEIRFSFNHKDFVWNHALSPEIYLELRGVHLNPSGIVEFMEPTNEAEELVIVMARIDTSNILFEQLAQGRIGSDDASRIGEQLAQQLTKVRTERPEANYYERFKNDIEDVRNWVKDIQNHSEELLQYTGFLETFRLEHKELYEGELSQQLAYSGDMHSHNALYTQGKFSLMDTYPPKEDWRIAYKFLPMYRLGADIYALAGKEAFDAYVSGYERSSGELVNHELDAPYLIYGATIMLAYLYMLEGADSKNEATIRYRAFLRDFYTKVSTN